VPSVTTSNSEVCSSSSHDYPCQTEVVVGLRGLKGDRGKDGNCGPEGMEGRPGPTGDRGKEGEKGERGDRGYKGDQGPRGFTGVVSNNHSEYIIRLRNTQAITTVSKNLETSLLPLESSIGAYCLKYTTDDHLVLNSVAMQANADESPNIITFNLDVSGALVERVFLSTVGNDYNPLVIQSATTALTYPFASHALYSDYIRSGAVFHLCIRWANPI
jgi:hypothetical protein